MDIKETNLRSRALIGGLLNTSSDCLENLRPRAQYMHTFRAHYKKVKDLLREGDWSDPSLKTHQTILKKIMKIYNEVGLPVKENCQVLSEKQLNLLECYGYKRTRDIKKDSN